MSDKLRPLLVDIRIPYCIRPENFRSRMQRVGSNEEKNAYLAAVKRELLTYRDELEGYEVQALRLSGGSATVMSPDLLGDLLKTARETLPVAHAAEFSVDAHPLTIGTPALTGIAAGRPNRMELMMCSENDSELRTMGCSFGVQHVHNAIRFFSKFRLNNVGLTVDLGIPGQTAASWENTVRACAIVHPAHITLQALKTEGTDGAPDAELRREMVRTACSLLKENGYLRYAAGHFCLPHCANRFELERMNGAEHIGLGLGATTLLDGYLTRCTNNLNIYLSCAGDFEKTTAEVFRVEPEAAMNLYAEQRLRSAEGLSTQQFCERFGCGLPDALQKQLASQAEEGLLEEKDGNFVPTEAGLFSRI